MMNQIFAQYPLAPITTKAQLVRHLQFCHALMVATDPLLTLAGMDRKRDEEQGHALWLEQDLANLGIPTIPYDFSAAAIAGAQYYWIQHLDPRVLLGYCAVLECRTFTAAQVDMMEAILGPLPCVRFHADHDQAHGAEVLKQIDAVENEILKQWIYCNARDTASAISAVTHLRFAKEPDYERSSDGHARSGATGSDGHEPSTAYCDGLADATRDAAAGYGHIGRA